ncbi:aminotransferase class V-fold PLP-dependent enzyme, partial [Escherichia coli]|nr:aminotransferase class V-fold PLP-dependent enzyme [Escherichia coli]
ILSRPFDTTKYSLIYAGAQKNLGPSGLTVVLIRRSLLERTRRVQPALLDYLNIAENDSMPNTPNTWAIYIMALVCEWLETEGGVAEI